MAKGLGVWGSFNRLRKDCEQTSIRITIRIPVRASVATRVTIRFLAKPITFRIKLSIATRITIRVKIYKHE